MLNLIGGADVRGLPGSDDASSIILPSEMENRPAFAMGKISWKKEELYMSDRDEKEGGWEEEDCVVGVGAAAIHFSF